VRPRAAGVLADRLPLGGAGALATARSQLIKHQKAQGTRVPREGAGGGGQPSMGAVVAGGGGLGVAPILVYWLAGLIGRAFRSKRGGRGREAGRPEMRGRTQRNGATQLGRDEDVGRR
jgi:hypothetical protein